MPEPNTNIGYGIEGVTPEGETVGIEVKAIDNPGQLFTLTSNEEAVARQKGKTYYPHSALRFSIEE